MGHYWQSVRRRGSRLSSRLLIAYLAIGLLGIGGLIAWTGQRLQRNIVEQAAHEMETQAQILRNALLSGVEDGEDLGPGRQEALQALVSVYTRGSNNRLSVFDTALHLVASSDPRVGSHTEHDSPEFVSARLAGVEHDVRWDTWGEEERLFVAAAITGEHNRILGFVQLSQPMAPVYVEIRRMWLGLLTAGAVVLFVLALVSVVLANGIARPIQKLTTVTEAVAEGQLDQRVTPAGPDEVKRLGRAFNQMTRQISDVLSGQSEFIANASHELRSPLAGLRLRLDLLQERGRGDPELTQRYLAQIEREVTYLQRLAEQLLALSTLDEGAAVARIPTDLAPLLYELADDMTPLTRHAGLALNVDVPPHLPLTAVDPEQIRIIVRNLLDNALKYTPADGEINLNARAAGPGVEIVVADTGVGIPPEALSRIFDRFYRVDKARARSQGGSGLGLALVRDLVEANGGIIRVASEPGAGTVFTVQLPAQPDA